MQDVPRRLRSMAEFSPESETITKIIPAGREFLLATSAYVDRLELALHRIVGHGNITGDKARTIAAEALGIKKPE